MIPSVIYAALALLPAPSAPVLIVTNAACCCWSSPGISRWVDWPGTCDQAICNMLPGELRESPWFLGPNVWQEPPVGCDIDGVCDVDLGDVAAWQRGL